MKKIIIILLSFFLGENNLLLAQEVFGKITFQESSSSQSYVLISVKPINFNTYSDKNGIFILPKLNPGEYIIDFSSVGFKKESRKFSVKENEKIELNINLIPIPFILNEVVVTGTFQTHLLKQTPVITEVINKEMIEQFNSQSLADVLPLQTGIDLTQSIGQTQNIKLQGLKKNQVLILIDGERISGRVDDAIDIGQIPVSYIEKIEIVKGPLSSVYGSEAIGGVINIITKSAKKDFTFGLNSIYGSFNRFDFGFNISNGFLISEKINYSFLFNSVLNKSDGIDYDNTDFTSELPGFEKKHFALKNELKFNEKFSVSTKSEFLTENNSWLAGGSKWVNFTDFSTNEKISNLINSKFIYSDKSYFNFVLNNSKNIHGSSEKTNSGFVVRNQTSIEEISSAKINSHFSPYNTSFITIGAETNLENVKSNRVLNYSKTISTNVIYFEDEWTIHPLVLNFGGRFSKNSEFGKFFAPRVSALYQATPNFSFRTSYGKGFRAPSVNELYIDFNHSSVGYKIEGNPNLQPENSVGINFGFDYSRDDLVWLRLNFYQNNVKNLIEYFNKPGTSQPVVISYHNIDATINTGADFDIDFRPYENLKLNFGYNYLSAINNKKTPLLFQSPNTSTIKLNYDFKNIYSKILLFTKWVDIKTVSDEQYDASNYQSDGTPKYKTIPSHFVWNASVSNKYFKNFNLSIGVNNIFNVKHYPFGQSKPREMYLSINYSNQN